MARQSRSRTATTSDARVRLRSAEAYLEVADLVLQERSRVEMPGVAAGLAVLAGIAAADAICAQRLGQVHRGEDHRAAGDLLKQATGDGRKLAATFRRLIDIKDEAHYGLTIVSPQRARGAVRAARLLVDGAREELER
ncbi:MAG: hypothetical protein ACYCO3_09850 [Mycobacteriales bacterium]